MPRTQKPKTKTPPAVTVKTKSFADTVKEDAAAFAVLVQQLELFGATLHNEGAKRVKRQIVQHIAQESGVARESIEKVLQSFASLSKSYMK